MKPRSNWRASSTTTAAVILEPVQGEGGVRIPSPGYLAAVRDLCARCGALLVFDEVQTGMGRTGFLLAAEAEWVAPDICSLAKGLGAGVPIGALLAREEVAASFGPGTHASTFGGNPLATAAALAATRVLLSDGVLEHCRAMGAYLLRRLETWAVARPVTAVRGRGLLLGVELQAGRPALEVVRALLERGFLTGTAGESVLRFAPPLIVERDEIDALLSALDEVL
jgi:acetylornithine/succinyldiaminopimelate/putrescine aminotransferase